MIGRTTDTRRFVIKHGGQVKADLPIKELGDEAPLYDRPWTPTALSPAIDGAAIVPPLSTDAALIKLLGSANFSSKRWVYEQYDSLILGNTVQGPGGGAAVIRLDDGPKGLALTTDCTERYCEADPRRGREAGGRGGLAQPRRRRREAAGADRQPQFRQPGEAARDGPAGRLPSRESPRRRKRSTSRSCRATCRSTTRRWARGFRRPRRSAASGWSPTSRRRLRRRSSARARNALDRRRAGLARPLGLAARSRRARRGRAAAGRSCRRAAQRRVRAGADRARAASPASRISPTAASRSRSRKWRWRAASAPRSSARSKERARLSVRRGSGPLCRYARPEDADALIADAGRAGVPAARLGTTGGDDLDLVGEPPIPLAMLRTAFEFWLPAFMDGKRENGHDGLRGGEGARRLQLLSPRFGRRRSPRPTRPGAPST